MQARSFPLVIMTIAVAVFFLALVPAPLVLSAVRPPVGRIGRYAVPVRQEQVRTFLRKHAGDILDAFQEILGASKGVDDKPESAANTAGLYIFNLTVGTPMAQDVAGVLDITLSFVWAQCESCSPCLAAPSFQWKASATFSPVPCGSQTCQQSVLRQTCQSTSSNCGYTLDYGGGRNTSGNLVGDDFNFGSASASRAADVLFGCSDASSGDFSGASGSFGFGRGPLSLVSQLQLSWFSYYLPASDDSDSSDNNNLQFGDDEYVPRSGQGVSISTPLLRNSLYPDLYYVKLKGIQVDGRDLTGIPAGTFDLQANGSGGVFLSTTTPATYLEEAAYNVVRRAFASGIASEPVNGAALGLDLCYAMPSIYKQLKVPKLTLVFDDGGAATSTARMELKKSNYFFADSNNGLQCLSIMPSRGGSVPGSLLQTGRNITYDLRGGQLVFETAFAPPPHHSKVSVSLMLLAPFAAWMLLF